jgi:solute carrier family 13 (sodium-dependent dicarboxylate transporter), member 2/3/5
VEAGGVQSPGTYRTLDEQTGRLSPAEERFERRRRTIGLFLGPLLFVAMLVAPLDLEPEQHRLAAVLILVITYWVTEAIPIPVAALLGLALAVLINAAPAPEEDGDTTADVVFGAFASSTIFLFIGGFIIAHSMMRHGLARRFAFRVLALPGVGRSTYRTIIAFGAIGALLSAFISNTAAAAMLFPIALGIVSTLSGMVADKTGGDADPTRLRFGTALMLMTAYGASVGGLLTPIGSPPNLIGREFIQEETGQTISFFEWVVTAAPIVLVMFGALCVILIALNRPEVRELEGAEEFIAQERAQLGPLSRGERNTLVAFGVAVTLWLVPGAVGLIAGDDSSLYDDVLSRLDEGVVAILAASLLFVLPLDWAKRRFTLNWNEAVNIDWGTIILFGSGIALGTLLSSTGLAKVMGDSLADLLGVSSLISITIIAVVIAVLISETTSNTASVAIVVPIVIPIAASAGVDPLIPALAAVFGASYGFMLPVSTPPNAIVYGSGMIPITKMIRSGAVFDVIGAILITFGVALMANVVGLV